jgi:hypothetical protein
MSYEALIELLTEDSLFEKLEDYVGNACYIPGEFG